MTKSVALVTGASGGIGGAIVEGLSHIVDDVIASGRDAGRLDGLEVTGRARIHRVILDVAADDVSRRTSALFEAFGDRRLILVNAAGDFGPVGGIGFDDPAAWLATLRTHVVGAVATMSAALPLMIDRGWGRVINVSSAQSLHGPDPAAGAYATAKAAMNVMTAGAAMQVEGSEVSVCAIHPGDVDTEMALDIRRKAAAAGESARHLADWGELIGSGAGDDPARAGDLVAEIVSSPADWSNGRFLVAATAAGRHPKAGWSMPVGPGGAQ